MGSDDWLSGVLLFLSMPPTPAPNYSLEQFDGGTWQPLPLEEFLSQQPEGVQLSRGSTYWGRSPHPWNLLAFTTTDPHVTSPIDIIPRYWVRLRNQSGPTLVIQRVLPQMYTTYATVSDVEAFLAVEFDDRREPVPGEIRHRIRAHEDWLDNFTRRTWRPRLKYNESAHFNPHGVRLLEYKPWFIVDVKLWNGSDFTAMEEGRAKDYYLDLSNGMLYFTQPSFRLRKYSWLFNRHLTSPGALDVTYAYGEDFEQSSKRELVSDIIKRQTAADLILQSDWTGLLSSGLENVSKEGKVKEWRQTAEDRAEQLRRLITV